MRRKALQILPLLALLGAAVACGGSEGPTQVEVPPDRPTAAPTETAIPAGPQATVVDLVNEVDAHPLPNDEWEDAQVDMTIYTGGEVWAQEASTARVGVEEDLVRVAPNTIFTLQQPDEDTTQLSLDEGQIWVNVEGLEPGETFEVETPGAVASVRGTRFGVRVGADDTTVVSTQEGTVTVTAASTAVTVTAGFQTVVPQRARRADAHEPRRADPLGARRGIQPRRGAARRRPDRRVHVRRHRGSHRLVARRALFPADLL
jgi:hypothetical protein